MESHLDKENIQPEVEQSSDESSTRRMNPPPCPSSQKTATKEARECPQTPVGRLPLSQLLANGDDTSQCLNQSPMERVLWEQSPLGSALARSQRKRKRAQSSSPTSSQKQSSKNSAPIDIQALQVSLKTPKASIVDDLWSRYSLHTHDKHSSQDEPRLPHTFHSSSPQTPGPNSHTRDSGGLRRAFSCIDWPTSAAKRRRLRYDLDERVVGASEFDRPIPSTERSKISRVNLLVDRIHQDLAKPLRPQQISSEASTSSPIPAQSRYPLEIDEVTSVLSQTAVADKTAGQPPLNSETKDRQAPNAFDASSEFGDEDLDIGIIEALTKATQGGIVEESSSLHTIGAGESDEEMMRTRLNTNGQHPEQKSRSSTIQQTLPSKDEFEDDDEEDMTAADLEDIFANYDAPKVYDTKRRDPVHTVDGDASCRPNASNEEREKHELKEKNTVATAIEVISDDEDEYGGDSDWEQVAVDYDRVSEKNVGASAKGNATDRNISVLRRFIVKSILASEYEVSLGHSEPEKVLSVQDEKTKLPKLIILRQAWIDTHCEPGSHVQIIGEFDKYGQCVVDNARNLLILHPDYLLSSTVVGDSFTCPRKAILEDRVKATSDANQSTIYGHMLHEIFQEAMRANRWDDVWMASTVEKIAGRHLEELFEINIDHALAVEQLKARITDLQAWAEIFISSKPKPNAIIKDRNGTQSLMCINKLLEVEEKVWSPRYGLKGNIDATVQVLLKDEDGTERTLTMPFELKTGKHSNAAHKAQTSLYTLLLSDRYDIDIACGILYYMQTSEISTVRALRHEILPMVMQRNLLAGFVRKRTELPPMLKRSYTCEKCYAKTTCFIYHKLLDDGNGETSAVGEKFEELTRHLKLEHQQFFSKWDSLLTKEERDIIKLRRELWTMDSSERERAGKCFSGVVIEPDSHREETNAPKINRFTYTFVKQHRQEAFSFLESQITSGEPIVISDEKGHFALANGYVNHVRKHKIQVIIDRRLHNARTRERSFDPEFNQAFAGIMEVKEDGDDRSTSAPSHSQESLVYRLDKDEFSNGMALIRSNLVKLMQRDLFGVQALRRLIVEGVAPTFRPPPPLTVLRGPASQSDLNVDQKAAIEKVMSAKDYALVLGMPGTGKTTTISQIIRSLVAQGKNVLLTSYTHTAVDNILLKLRKDNIGIFRLGAIAKVHPEIHDFADLAGRPMTTVEDLKRCYTRQVVATTCLGINHPIFNQRVFDYCIVDEASQITLPVCLGPIRMAKAFILVGDHYQLPPLVQNKEALEGGLDISLFKMLSDKHPSSVVNLEHQYRMCEDIMTLSNTLIYKGRLKCGTPAVAAQSISISDMPALKRHHHDPSSVVTTDTRSICIGPSKGTCWLRDLLDPSTKACFVNTDPLGHSSREILENGSRITNPGEAALTVQIVESLLTVGVAPTEIGIITLYRSQLALMKQGLRNCPGIEMHTADRFQGRDKGVAVLSLVRSNEMQVVGDLLKDWRRVNVALTRARTKLLILGSKSTLISNDLLSELISLMEVKGWCYNLPPNALDGHVFEDANTQFSSSRTSCALIEDEALKPVSRAMEGIGRGATVGKENANILKKPLKQGRLDVQSLIGKRPVLRDIVNDAA